MNELRAAAGRIGAELIELRHTLHRCPEPGLDLPQTGALIRAQIDGLGLEVSECRSATGFMAVLRGEAGAAAADANRPVVLLRADMDGLPIREESGEPFAATTGTMHACGHDLHMAGLVGAMRILAARRARLGGDVVFMFQPGEEGHDGAQHMIDEGMLEAAGRLPDHAYGLHVWAARFPAGAICTRPGPMMASSDTLRITVVGRGGHGSAPHEALDPIPVAAEIITQVQVMVAREFAIFDPVVATCGAVHAGTACNVIPDTATLSYTLRAFATETRARLKRRMCELARQVCAAHGARAELEMTELYPVTANDEGEYGYCGDTLRAAFPGRWLPQPQPMAVAEDFSKVLERIPGCFLGVSAIGRNEDADPAALPFNHSARARFADAVVPDCAAVLATLAWHRLAVDAPGAGGDSSAAAPGAVAASAPGADSAPGSAASS